MSEAQEYAVGLCQKPFAKGGWSDHLGYVDHYYGPVGTLAHVRTACGRKGRMHKRDSAETLPTRLGPMPCKICQKVLDRLTKEVTDEGA